MVFNILNFSYLIGLITCFICNLVINHRLSWFLIVLLGILISFTITSLPLYLKRDKYRWLKVTIIFTILVYLLLVTINYINNGDWLVNSFKIATWFFIILWSGVLICTFANIDKSIKISISLILSAILVMFTNPLCEVIFNIVNEDNNIANIIISIIMIISSVCIGARGIKIRKK